MNIWQRVSHFFPRFSVPYFREITSNAPDLLNDLFQLNREGSFGGMCVVAKEKVERPESDPAERVPKTPVSARRKSPMLKPRSSDLNLTGFVSLTFFASATTFCASR